MLLMRDIFSQMVNTPMAAGAKFLHLKYLEVYLDGDLSTGYDYLSLVSFLDASPVLETFMFSVSRFSSCKKICCICAVWLFKWSYFCCYTGRAG
jgi:hypothetical protein